MSPRPASPQSARQAGYVLLAVLLLAVLMVSMTMSYARHTLMAADNSGANLRAQTAEQAAGSGFAWAKQSLLASGATAATLSLGSDAALTVSVADGGNARRAITVAATGPGTSQQVAATAETFATTNGRLPLLTGAAKAAVTGGATLINVSGNASYSNTELTGILYLRFGSSVTLRNVILTGAIVSEAAVIGTWTPAQSTTITLDKGVLIEPGSVLPGCAIIAPDASVAGTGAERVQLEGVVVAAALSLPGSGSVHAQIATTATPVLSTLIELPGAGRAPRSWPSVLDTGALGLSRVVFLRADATQGERDAIETFAFPASAKGGF